MTDTFCTGDYSYYANAVRTGPSGGASDTAAMFPPGWAGDSPNETRSSAIHWQAERGLWLPLFIPEGCDGHRGDIDPVTGELLPEIIYYAANHVSSDFDQKFAAVNSSPESDKERWDYAVALATDAAKNTSGGGPNVRELQ